MSSLLGLWEIAERGLLVNIKKIEKRVNENLHHSNGNFRANGYVDKAGYRGRTSELSNSDVFGSKRII